jgi:hypothetical protein
MATSKIMKPYLENKAKRPRTMAQVMEPLPSKCRALHSKPQYYQKKLKKRGVFFLRLLISLSGLISNLHSLHNSIWSTLLFRLGKESSLQSLFLFGTRLFLWQEFVPQPSSSWMGTFQKYLNYRFFFKPWLWMRSFREIIYSERLYNYMGKYVWCNHVMRLKVGSKDKHWL